jgi:hypothetical protein
MRDILIYPKTGHVTGPEDIYVSPDSTVKFVRHDSEPNSIAMTFDEKEIKNIRVILITETSDIEINSETGYFVLSMDHSYRIMGPKDVMLFELGRSVYRPIFTVINRHKKSYSLRTQHMMSGDE